MRLIDADPLKAKMPTIEDEYKYAHKLIDDASTVDAIPVAWIESQVDKGKWAELVQRWAERKEE